MASMHAQCSANSNLLVHINVHVSVSIHVYLLLYTCSVYTYSMKFQGRALLLTRDEISWRNLSWIAAP